MNRSNLFRVALAAMSLAMLFAPASARGPQSDPFAKKPTKKVTVAKPVTERVIPPPALDVRAAECKKSAAPGQQVQSLPCMYLVRELKLQGVFRTGNQAEAFLLAEPTKQSITVREGDRLFDGRVISIREPGPSGGGQVVLEKVTKKQVGKKITETTESVTLDLASAGL